MSVIRHRREDDGLTHRELEILQHVATGMSNQEIADMLLVSERTIRTHVSNILSKMLVENRTQAALAALETGLAGEPAKTYSHRNNEVEPPTTPGAFWGEWPEEVDLVLIACAPWGEWRMRRSIGEWSEYKPHKLRMAGVRWWGPIPAPFEEK